MDPINGIVHLNDVPPTLGVEGEGMVLTFSGHDPIHLLCNRKILFGYITNPRVAPKEVNHPSFALKIGSRKVTLVLPKPVKGHGHIQVKKSEFMALLKFDNSPL